MNRGSAPKPIGTGSADSCLPDVDGTAPAAVTRRRIIRGALAAAAGLVGSLALPAWTRADHFGCRYPDGTGAPYYLDFAKLYSSKLPDGSLLDPITIVQRAYCGYLNGSFPVGKVDLGQPYRDPRSGKLHLWDGSWNQNFEGPRGYTNLMIQPRNGRAYRLDGDWLATFVERGGPRAFGAPTDDAHQAGPGVEQYFQGGGAGQAGFFRRRDGAPVYVVQGAILERYKQETGTSGRLGAPTSNEYAWRGGTRSDFANGSIVYHPGGRVEVLIGASPSPATGVCTQPGQGAPADIAQKFRDAHAAARELIGAPGKDQNGCAHKWGDVWTQDFFNAAGEQTNLMYQSQRGQVYRLYGDWLRKFLERGGPDVLGAPSDDPTRRGNGDEQYFLNPTARNGAPRNGGMFRKVGSKQIFVVQGAILDLYYSERGTSGALGFPVTDEQDARFGRVSHFDRGSIYWNGPFNRTLIIKAVEFPNFADVEAALRSLPDNVYFYVIIKVGSFVKKYRINQMANLVDLAQTVNRDYFPYRDEINRRERAGLLDPARAKNAHIFNKMLTAMKFMPKTPYLAIIRGYYEGLAAGKTIVLNEGSRSALLKAMDDAIGADDYEALDYGSYLQDNWDAVLAGREIPPPPDF